jgi:hypothetical protein
MHELSGTLERLHLGDLMEWLHLTRATGRLSLAAGSVTRAFDVHRGKIAFASSSRASERLASWLLRKQIAPMPILLRTLAYSQTRGELFTSVVMREAQLTTEVMVEAGRALATALATRLLQEERVLFTFDPSWPVAERLQIDLQLECSSLIMQAAYRVDTLPPADRQQENASTTLDPKTVEALFWRIAGDLEGEHMDVATFAEAHRTFLAVGELLNRWVQGPPLLPIGPADRERVTRRLETGEAVRLEDSPTLVWDLLALVNGLDCPSYQRASGGQSAWDLAGEDAALLVRLLIDSPRWQRGPKPETDLALWLAACKRVAAARPLAPALELCEETAMAAAALPVVILELVATALATTPLATPAMQRCALHHLLPVVATAAGNAAGLPELLIAAIAGVPAESPAVHLGALLNLAAGELPGFRVVASGTDARPGRTLSAALNRAREAADEVSRSGQG